MQIKYTQGWRINKNKNMKSLKQTREILNLLEEASTEQIASLAAMIEVIAKRFKDIPRMSNLDERIDLRAALAIGLLQKLEDEGILEITLGK